MVKKIFWFCFGILISFNASNGMNAPEVSFEKIKSELQLSAVGLSAHIQTLPSHRRKYGYNGNLIHIVKYPNIIGAGFIIEDAQPVMWWSYGYWYAESCVPQNRIFIEDDNLKYEAEVKSGADIEPKILSSGLFSDGSKNTMNYNLAVMWKVAAQLIKGSDGQNRWEYPVKEKYYITRAFLSEIQSRNNVFDLDNGKVEISLK